jgi:hypothetical protein
VSTRSHCTVPGEQLSLSMRDRANLGCEILARCQSYIAPADHHSDDYSDDYVCSLTMKEAMPDALMNALLMPPNALLK